MHTPSVKQTAIRLRKEGYTYSHIAKVTGLSKSTLSGWLSDIPYTPNAQTVETYGKARAAASKRKAEIRQQELLRLRKSAKSLIGTLTKRDLFIFGLAIYLGEGGKTQGITRVSNSDPRIIIAAIEWFKSLGVENSQFRPRIHLYPESDTRACTKYWSEVTGVPMGQFYPPSVDRRQDKKVARKRKLPYGTLHLNVCSGGRKEFGVLFFRSIAAWSEEALGQIEAGVV